MRRLALLAASLWATQAPAQDEALFFSDMPTVFTVSRMPQALSEAPGFVTLIDRDTIRASGVRSISDLLRLVPGFQVTARNLDAPRVTYHGLSDEDYSPRLQVLVDGRSQYSPLFLGGVNWNLMPVALEDIERIEVVRGTNAAAYGTNAFMGVINIITVDASQARGFTTSVNHGDQGVRDEFLRWGGQLGPASVRLSYRHQADNGIRFIPQSEDDARHIANAQKNRLFDLRADLPLTDRDELQLGFGHVEMNLETGRADQLPENPPRQSLQYSQYAQLNWRRNLGDGNELQIRYYRTQEKLKDRVRSALPLSPAETAMLNLFTQMQFGKTFPSDPYFDENVGGHSTRDELELQHTLAPTSSTRLVWGLSTRWDKVSAPLYYHARSEVQRDVQRAFGNLEWRPDEKWLLNLGGSFEQDSLSGEHFSPRLSLSHHLSPAHTLRAGVARAWRTPSTYDQTGQLRYGIANYPDFYLVDYLASSKVVAERLNSYELGYYGELKDWRLSLDLRAFREVIPNRIQLVERNLQAPNCNHWPAEAPPPVFLAFPCGGADYAVNAEHLDIRGLEYQLRWQPWEKTRLILNQAATRIHSRLLDFDTTNSGDNLTRIQDHSRTSSPLLSTTLMLMQKLPLGMDLAITASHVGEMKWTRNNNGLLPAYNRVDWRLAYPFKLGPTRGELAYTAQSANSSHLEYKNSRRIDPRHWLSLRFDL